MAIIEWKDSMAIGIYNIDKQHKELVALINDIDEAADQEATQAALSGLIRRFFDYTMNHFRDEESLMDHETYPQYFQQVYEHTLSARKKRSIFTPDL